LVLRDFFDVEGGFWAFFRRVLDRTFHHDFGPLFTSVELGSVIESWLAGRRLVQGPTWVRALHIRRISTLHVFPFAIFFANLSRPLKVRVMPTSLFGDCTGSISIVGARVSVDFSRIRF
jgi:hypothetical protein